jgi:hypothetical protein
VAQQHALLEAKEGTDLDDRIARLFSYFFASLNFSKLPMKN